jgi:hypothetical protein
MLVVTCWWCVLTTGFAQGGPQQRQLLEGSGWLDSHVQGVAVTTTTSLPRRIRDITGHCSQSLFLPLSFTYMEVGSED